MQTEMTERDKRLIVALSIFVIVVAIAYWGIRPALKDIKAINKDIEEQQEIEKINEKKLSMLTLYQAMQEEYLAEVDTKTEQFYPMMNSDEIDKLFTLEVLKRGFSSYDLAIAIDDMPVDMEPYMYSELAAAIETGESTDTYENVSEESLLPGADKKEDESEDENEDNDSGESEDASELLPENVNTDIYSATVTMRLGGDKKALENYIDDLYKTDKKLLVNSYAWSEDVTIDAADAERALYVEEDGGVNVNVETVLDISVTIYMYKE